MASKKKTPPGRAPAATLNTLNEALEAFNEKSAMNFDGPGEWHDWVVEAVESKRGLQLVKLCAGKVRTTVKFSASVALVENGAASSEFSSAVTDRLMDLMDGVEVSDDVVRADPNAGRLAPLAAPRLTDAQRKELRLREERALAKRIAALEAAEKEADTPPTLDAFKNALKKEPADEFQSLLERADGKMTKLAIDTMFKVKTDANFIAEAIDRKSTRLN